MCDLAKKNASICDIERANIYKTKSIALKKQFDKDYAEAQAKGGDEYGNEYPIWSNYDMYEPTQEEPKCTEMVKSFQKKHCQVLDQTKSK